MSVTSKNIKNKAWHFGVYNPNVINCRWFLRWKLVIRLIEHTKTGVLLILRTVDVLKTVFRHYTVPWTRLQSGYINMHD